MSGQHPGSCGTYCCLYLLRTLARSVPQRTLCTTCRAVTAFTRIKQCATFWNAIAWCRSSAQIGCPKLGPSNPSTYHWKFVLVRIVYRYRTYRKRQGNPSVITVLSAPNCGGRGNKAAVLTCHGKEYTVQQFNWTLHPYRIPKFMDAFNWSLPFICEKGELTRPLHAIMFVVN